jgi:hypothetical protein
MFDHSLTQVAEVEEDLFLRENTVKPENENEEKEITGHVHGSGVGHQMNFFKAYYIKSVLSVHAVLVFNF